MAEHVKELLSAYIDNEINRDEEEKIPRHLKECEHCREALYELQLLRENVFYAYESIVVPDTLETSIMGQIQGPEQESLAVSPLAGWATGLVAMLVLATMVMIVAPFMYVVARILSIFATIAVKILHTVPIIIDAIPYFSTVLYSGAIVLIIISVWFLYRLVISGSFDRRELS
jgi:predicted anti-sigma-YlaC factor YlaD